MPPFQVGEHATMNEPLLSQATSLIVDLPKQCVSAILADVAV